jgi:hypothetical protein
MWRVCGASVKITVEVELEEVGEAEGGDVYL